MSPPGGGQVRPGNLSTVIQGVPARLPPEADWAPGPAFRTGIEVTVPVELSVTLMDRRESDQYSQLHTCTHTSQIECVLAWSDFCA